MSQILSKIRPVIVPIYMTTDSVAGNGLATWNRILRAIEELRSGKRPEGAEVH